MGMAKSESSPAPKRKFLQRDYKKGPFFQSDNEPIYKRDFSEPTGEDKLDKKLLPKVMQVKGFGRRGRVKWTHLVNEDTSRWDTPWSSNNEFRAQYDKKMDKPIERPRGSKKMKMSVQDLYEV
ncbi:hypothetical protein SELMODRAFT_421618 [Selaginella moellendorffii]|uniref:Micro-fibrillar-associated protein 1 C-terminal domain-containing protein n=1 Tax=Selaginella moellendorffii TaxID=88036 RepID=D8SFU2_SELML|nr:microfibrillar-associated protein 1 [Selaginella moellendorffii]EFJ16897.1 hypothetical protein SELMODRAFT_421618 [Selaginella moellendorffii]|eukprot:XP_002982229.1 microfibrillar-associated protein 1 [Selaginella moellendorffii]